MEPMEAEAGGGLLTSGDSRKGNSGSPGNSFIIGGNGGSSRDSLSYGGFGRRPEEIMKLLAEAEAGGGYSGGVGGSYYSSQYGSGGGRRFIQFWN